MEYNTERDQLLLMEYGRNVQKIVSYISELPDKDMRTMHSHTLIGLMKMLNPSVRENSDNPQRIWDHLFVMSNFKLDIDGPYPMPEEQMLHKRPQPLPYTQKPPKFMNYGKNIEIMIEGACNLPTEEERENAYLYIARMMKSFYQSWHRDTLDDAVIVQHLKDLSDGKIDLSQALEESEGTLLQSAYSGRVSHPHQQEQQRSQQTRTRNGNQRHHGNNNNNRSGGGSGNSSQPGNNHKKRKRKY